MVSTYRRVRLLLLFVATIALTMVGYGALVPSLREHVASSLGLTVRSDATLAMNSCVVEKSDGDDIYFLSCGGIY